MSETVTLGAAREVVVELRGRIAALEDELAAALMCDGCAGRGDDANCGCGGSGRMTDMVVSLREAALVELPEKVRRLEAEPEERLTEWYAQRADEIDALKAELAEKDAALAAAHEALREIADRVKRDGSRVLRPADEEHADAAGACNASRRIAEKALSAPALKRPAEELRLLREVGAAALALEDVAFAGAASDSGVNEDPHELDFDQRLRFAERRNRVAMDRYRRFREEQG